jgi:hypothetical protein
MTIVVEHQDNTSSREYTHRSLAMLSSLKCIANHTTLKIVITQLVVNARSLFIRSLDQWPALFVRDPLAMSSGTARSVMMRLWLDVVFLIPLVDWGCRAVDEGLDHDRQVEHERSSRTQQVPVNDADSQSVSSSVERKQSGPQR